MPQLGIACFMLCINNTTYDEAFSILFHKKDEKTQISL